MFYVLHYVFVKMWTLGQLWLATSKGKKHCVQLRLGEVVDVLLGLQYMQLNLM